MVTIKFKLARWFGSMGMAFVLFLTTGIGWAPAVQAKSDASAALQANSFAIVFVQRQISRNGSLYYPSGGALPGVAPFTRFQVASPGKLLVREASGTIRTLIDGSKPTAASLNLIDVNAPDVSYDGKKIVFAGLPAGSYSREVLTNPGAWRLYVINVDGTGLRQLTFSDRNIDLSQFGPTIAPVFTVYDDTDPAWLPDGRIVFSSTRWPSFAMYGSAHTTNLFVVNADGTGLHRITGERNGADRPLVDPLTGKIVYSRWWRNFRTATNSMATVKNSFGGYITKDGLCAINNTGTGCQEVGGVFNLDRNAWHLATINPDGTGLVQFAGKSNSFFLGEDANFGYGGSFAPDGSIYTSFFPMMNGTEASGFGGIRRFQRGVGNYQPIIGITTRDESTMQFVSNNPKSYAVYVGNYAAEPEVLPNGQVVISWAQDTIQDYGLYLINADGSGRTLLYDNPGTAEVRARAIRPRPLPPIIPDRITKLASALPPKTQPPYDIDGTFSFQALNVYFNAPVDMDIMSGIPVGSANTIRFFTDHQRNLQTGSHEEMDFPILLQEAAITPAGAVTVNLPANLPLFEQIRSAPSAGYQVPLTSGAMFPGSHPGAAHVAGLNYGRSGDVVQCVGCHAGHTMIPLPQNLEDAQWTNLAPGATVKTSSVASFTDTSGLVDRRVKMAVNPDISHQKYWQADPNKNKNAQWAQLTFAVPVRVRMIRLYDIPAVDLNINVQKATVHLYSDVAGTIEVANQTTGALTESGTNVPFNDVVARVIRVELNSVSGSHAGLAEVEVIARGEAIAAIPDGTSTGSFSDVPNEHPYREYIEILYANGLTSGCSTTPLKFCPDLTMDRAQSAVFMMRGNFGSQYVPLAPAHIFNDNWSNAPWAEGWAEAMFNAGLTSGCSPSPLRFCPYDQLVNVQAAVFALRLKYGVNYIPPSARGTVFADLTDVNFWGTAWAEQAYAEGIIPACAQDTGTGKPKFCPDTFVSRGFGAYMIVKAKGLTMP